MSRRSIAMHSEHTTYLYDRIYPNILGFLLCTLLKLLYAHTSNALEGNTLTLGDTHFVLQEGLTISGKPIKDHQEVIGHARAIDLLYRSLSEPLTEAIVFALHRVVQSEQITDICKPIGAWKVELNGTHAAAANGSQVFIECAMPHCVPVLMTELQINLILTR